MCVFDHCNCKLIWASTPWVSSSVSLLVFSTAQTLKMMKNNRYNRQIVFGQKYCIPGLERPKRTRHE
jgi:hypothetical protein